LGFELKAIVFCSLVFSRYNHISRLCTFFNEASIYQHVFFVTFDKLKLGNQMAGADREGVQNKWESGENVGNEGVKRRKKGQSGEGRKEKDEK